MTIRRHTELEVSAAEIEVSTRRPGNRRWEFVRQRGVSVSEVRSAVASRKDGRGCPVNISLDDDGTDRAYPPLIAPLDGRRLVGRGPLAGAVPDELLLAARKRRMRGLGLRA